MVVRGRWAPPPMEGKGPREGQRMAIGQLAPPAAHQNTPMCHTKSPLADNTRHNPHPCAPCVAKETQHTQQRHEGEGRGFVLRSPKEGLSAGTWRRKVVMCPRRGNDPTSGHPKAHLLPLGRGILPPAWDGRLDAPGQRRRHLPSSAWTQRTEVKQGKSGGSVGTTDQGKGKGRSGERPMGTTAYAEKGSKGRAANGDRPVGAASCRREQHTMVSCQNPPSVGLGSELGFRACGHWIMVRMF